MKKYYYFLLSMLFFYPFTPLGAEIQNTAPSSDSKERPSERLVYVYPFKDRSSSKIDIGLMEKTLSECLAQRKSPRLFPQKDERTADLNIQVEILKYTYSTKDISKRKKKRKLLIDALIEKNQAVLDTVFIVRSRKGFLLWKRKIRADFAQNNMTYEEALSKVFKKTCRIFINKCFGKSSPLSQSK